jgi:hypothetical protein
MDSNSKLLELIKKAAGTYKIESLNAIVGEVIAVNMEELTCDVKLLTGLSFNADLNSDIIYEGVALTSGGVMSDGFIIIPEIGSQVTVLTSKYQQAFIIQYSDASAINIISDKTQINLGTQINLSIDDGSIVTLTEKFDIKSKNGAEISGDTKITIKNNSANLKDINSDIRQNISDLSNYVNSLNLATNAYCASAAVALPALSGAAATFAAASTIITTNIVALQAQLTVLQTKIDSLLE